MQNFGLPKTNALRFKIKIDSKLDFKSTETYILPWIKNTLSQIHGWNEFDWNSIITWKQL